MTAFWAIVGDTWRQSKHQWVMLVMLLCFAFVIWLALYPVETRTAPDGQTILTAQTGQERVRFGLEAQWEGLLASSLRHRIGWDDKLAEGRREVDALYQRWNDADYEVQRLMNTGASPEEISNAQNIARDLQAQMEAKEQQNRDQSTYVRSEVNKLIAERTGNLSKLEKGAEWHMAGVVQLIFTVAMFGFIAVCAGYFPGMLEAGNVDLVMSKPIRRWHIFFGKYLGGLLLFSTIIIAVYAIIFVGFGLKTGVWLWQFFGGLPMTLFSLALLYAIVGWVGLLTRSTSMAMVIGYVYYVVVDTAVGALTDPGDAPLISKLDWLQDWVDILKVAMPSFHWLRKSAEATVFSVIVTPWEQVASGAAWLVIALGTAYNRFRINDY